MPSKYSVCLLSLLVLMPALASAQQGAAQLKMRVGEHASYDRLVFDAPAGFSYSYSRDKAKVTLAFKKAAKLTIKPTYLRRARGVSVIEGQSGKKPLILRFYVDPKAEVTHFKNDNSIVIDVKGIKLSDKAFALLKKVDVPKVALKKKILGKEQKVEKTEPSEKKAAPKKEIVDSKVTKVKAGVAPTPKAAPVKEVTEVASPKIKRAWPPRVQNPMRDKDVKYLYKIAKETNPKPIVVFDPKVSVGVAVFQRAGYVTILFDRKLKPEAFPDLNKARVPLLPFSTPHNVGYRIRVPDHIGIRAMRKGTAWRLFLIPGKSKPLLTTEFITQPDFALGARMLVPSAHPPKPVKIMDPVVGDELLVLPLQEQGAFTVRRRLSDFQIVPSVQGLVIKPWHERVVARIVADGIEISAEGGLKLSRPEDMGVLRGAIDKRDGVHKSLFDFKRWAGREEFTLAQNVHKLWQTVINVEPEQRVLARLDLARLYFAHGLGYEALSILDVIRADLPDIEQHPDFISLRGACRILVGRVKEGLKDLSRDVLKPQPDITLWRAVGAALTHDWKNAVNFFRKTMPLLEGYPEPMRSRFWVLAIESAVASNSKKDVVTWLSRIEKKGYSENVHAAVSYLRAVLHSQAGRVDLAEKLWKEVAEGSDRLYKIRSELALVDLGVATGSLTVDQAIERLEGLRYSWRGDGLELDVLKRLGGFYIEGQKYRDGFRTLFEVLRLFPDAPQTKQLHASMIKTFQDLFLTDLGKDLSPLEGLALYTDFGALIPKGEDGNTVRSNLAERLVNIDLLDQAVILLEDMYDHARSAQERIETALRIAGVRLLDHRAEKAMVVLDKVKEAALVLNPKIAQEWRLLHARTLSEEGKYQEALAALPKDGSKTAKLLHADMALRARNWSDATEALLDLVGPPLKEGQKLTNDQASWLVHAAVAMAKNMDTVGLDRLAIDYGKAMEKTSRANVFGVLTRPDETTQLKDIKAAQSHLSEVDMFRGVLDGYRKSRAK